MYLLFVEWEYLLKYVYDSFHKIKHLKKTTDASELDWILQQA